MHKISKKIKSVVVSGLMLSLAMGSFVHANEVKLEGEIDVYTNEDVDGGEGDLPLEGEDDKEQEDEEDDSNDEDVQIVITSILEAIKEDNVGKKAKISATVKSVNGGYITITDGSNEIDIFLKIDNDLGEIKENYKVAVNGTIEKNNDNIVLSLYNLSDITIEIVEDDKEELPESSIGDNSKPNTSNKPSQSRTPSVQGGTSANQVSSVKKVYARTNIIISYDLSESQWDDVKEALEEGTIKVVDLPENKIRIKKVSNGYGDRVWIVNDPRNLDKELEENVKNIGLDSMKGLKYSDYDVTESKWNDIIEDIQEGNAKVKILDDGLKVIYNKSSKSDYILEIEKK